MNEQFLAQIRKAEARYLEHADVRREREENLATLPIGGDWRKIDQPDRVLRRALRLGFGEMTSEALSVSALEGGGIEPMGGLVERIIGPNDLIDIIFMLEGAQVARSVGRVVIRGAFGQLVGYGTGFMISPQLLMTNNHVLDSASVASKSSVQFNYYRQRQGDLTVPVEFAFQPNIFFVTHQELDFSIVAVEPVNSDGVRVRARSWNPLIAETGKILVGERVNIIQHPGGEPQQLAFRQNRIVDLLDDFVHYISDTERGSSGSPVFNDQWELAALHHAGVPNRDSQQRILLKSGDPWNGDQATVDQIDWIANEGVRVSRIVAHINSLRGQMTADQRRLYEEVFLPRPSLEEVVESAAASEPRPTPSGPGVGPDSRVAGAGNTVWHIPVSVQLVVGDPVRAGDGAVSVSSALSVRDGQPSPAVPVPAASSDDSELRTALNQIQAFAASPYHDAKQDASDREAYYAEIGDTLGQGERYSRLRDLLIASHVNVLSYKEARLQFLYPWVDVHETNDGQRELRSIYSGKGFAPEEAIRGDLEVSVRREVQLREAMLEESHLTNERVEFLLDELEALMPFNCEHVVPQSWFGKKNPMKSDLHHLFACEPDCNSFRGNIPYYEFGPEDERVVEDCGRREGDKFEPAASKGVVARASLYFLLRYPGLVGDENREMQFERLATLLQWHQTHPVATYELHRNAAIFAIQGNRNPLIDFPEWAEQIDFALGFGMA